MSSVATLWNNIEYFITKWKNAPFNRLKILIETLRYEESYAWNNENSLVASLHPPVSIM